MGIICIHTYTYIYPISLVERINMQQIIPAVHAELTEPAEIMASGGKTLCL